MGEAISKQNETLKDYRADQEMERVQSQRLNIKEKLTHQVTSEKKAEEEGGSHQGGEDQHLQLDAAQRKAEESVRAAVGFQEGVLGQYDWREHLGWNENQDSFGSQISSFGSQEDFLLPMQVCNMRPWRVQRQSQPVQFQKL